MPQYIMLVNFTDQGLKGVKDVPNRQDKSRRSRRIPAAGRALQWMSDETTLGQATRTAVRQGANPVR